MGFGLGWTRCFVGEGAVGDGNGGNSSHNDNHNNQLTRIIIQAN